MFDLLWDMIFFPLYIDRLKEYADKPFACPNCGNVFYTKWQKLYWGREYTLQLHKKARLKCPGCMQKDMCTWKDDYPKK